MVREKKPRKEEIEAGEREERIAIKNYVEYYLPTNSKRIFGFGSSPDDWYAEKLDKYSDIDFLIYYRGKPHHYVEVKVRTIPIEEYERTMISLRKVYAAMKLKHPVYFLVVFRDAVALIPACREFTIEKYTRHNRNATRKYAMYPVSKDDNLMLPTEKSPERWKWCGWKSRKR